MLEGSTLTWILWQILAVVAVLAGVLGLVVYRQRVRYQRLLRGYLKLKRVQRPGRARRAPVTVAEPEPGEDLLAVASADSLERYQQATGKKLGDYSTGDPFSARIASLRYHYLQAELAARDAGSDHVRWQLLEKALSKLIGVMVEQNTRVEKNGPDRTALLQQRVQALKCVERDNTQLREQNQRFGRELKKLHGYYRRYRQLVAELDTPRIRPSAQSVRRQGVDKIAHAHDAHRQIVSDMRHHVEHPDHRDFYADKKPLMHQLDDLKAGVEDYSQNLKGLHQQAVQEVGADRKVGMIQTLRENNRSQRNTIIDLRKELNCLKRAVIEEPEAHDSEGDTLALERMVRECEDCIATLESEVEYLHDQLDPIEPDRQSESEPNRSAARESASQAGSDPVTDVLLAFSLGIIETHTPEAVMQLVADTLVQFNLAFALCQRYEASQPLFKNTTGTANAPMRAHLDALAAHPHQIVTADGLEYGRDCFQVFVPAGYLKTVGADRLLSVLDFMHGLVRLQLDHLNSLDKLAGHHREVVKLAERVRGGVTNIDIQYAYQTEENKRIVDNLIIEVQQLVGVLDADDDMQTIFDNAIKEAQQRFQLLYESGSAVDWEIAQLSESLDEMEKHQGH